MQNEPFPCDISEVDLQNDQLPSTSATVPVISVSDGDLNTGIITDHSYQVITAEDLLISVISGYIPASTNNTGAISISIPSTTEQLFVDNLFQGQLQDVSPYDVLAD